MEEITIYREFSFDSAHFLSKVPEEHKCRKIHGHTYRLKVYLRGPIDPHKGWLIDFAELKTICLSVIDKIDHQLLNDIEGLENPTCELLLQWIWQRLKPKLPLLCKLELNETASSGAIMEI